MDASKLEPQPEEGDTNNSETLDRAMLVSTHAFTVRRAHQEPRALPPHSHGLREQEAASKSIGASPVPVPAALEPAGASPDKPARASPQPAPPGAHTSLASPVLPAL
eukprot:scaffold74537_cov56-Phaeocystis_antarctica.AAC.2